MTLTHSEMVCRAAVWLRNHGAVVVTTECSTWGCMEQPDVLGFYPNGVAVVVECKVSRADYMRDSKKTFRQPGRGMGTFRYYATTHGIITPDEVPVGWGLIQPHGGGMRQRKRPTAFAEHDDKYERMFMVQMLRHVWDKDWRLARFIDIEKGVMEEMQRQMREAAGE